MDSDNSSNNQVNVNKYQEFKENLKKSTKEYSAVIFNKSKNFLHNAFNPPPSLAGLETKEPPMYNTLTGTSQNQGPPYGRDPKNWMQVQPYNYKQILDIVRRCPEAIGIINELKTAILSDGFRFETADGSAGGRNKIKKAMEFVEDNFFKQEMEAALQDWFLLGDAALWKGQISPTQLKEKYGGLFTEMEYKQIIHDEDSVKMVKHIPWSTMTIGMNEAHTAIFNFEQNVNGIGTRNYDVSEVIHAKLMTWDGKAYGYTPAIAGLTVINQLNIIKDINGMYFDKGGTPDKMFILEKEAPNSKRQQRLQQLLREYQQNYQKHGNMVMTGEVKIEDLNKFDKDMEFRQQAIYLTGVLALSFNMPMSKINVVVGTEAKAGARSEDISDQSYWQKISEAQDYWEQLLNTQLWKPHFGVSMKFNRSYKNDEIKETQANLQHMQLLELVYKAGLIKNNNSEYASNKLGIEPKYRSDKPYKVAETMGFGGMPGKPGGGPKPANNPQVMDGPATQKMKNDKKDEQNSKPRIQEKEMEFKETLSIPWEEFKKLKDKLDLRKPMGTSGLLHYTKINDNYIVYLSTPDFKYRTEVNVNLVSRPDLTHYILSGIQINGMVRTVLGEQVV